LLAEAWLLFEDADNDPDVNPFEALVLESVAKLPELIAVCAELSVETLEPLASTVEEAELEPSEADIELLPLATPAEALRLEEESLDTGLLFVVEAARALPSS
jgi:hypothetical protein